MKSFISLDVALTLSKDWQFRKTPSLRAIKEQ